MNKEEEDRGINGRDRVKKWVKRVRKGKGKRKRVR